MKKINVVSVWNYLKKLKHYVDFHVVMLIIKNVRIVGYKYKYLRNISKFILFSNSRKIMFVQSVEYHPLQYNQHPIHVHIEAEVVGDDHHIIIEILQIEIIILILIIIILIVEHQDLNVNRDTLLYSLFRLI
jgi:hypothetical protein